MDIDVNVVEQMVRKAIADTIGANANSSQVPSKGDYGVFNTMNDAIDASFIAQQELLHSTMAQRQKYVDIIREVSLKRENLDLMSRLAVEETEIGNYEHKVIKNTLAAEKTPGTEDLITEAKTGDDGLTLIEYCPFGVIGAITPTTNPTETIINNSISMIAGGNTVVYSPHPRATKVSHLLIK